MAAKKQDSNSAAPQSDEEILEDMRDRIYEDLKITKPEMKVSDLVKIIELKNKLTASGKSGKKLWNAVDDARKEKLEGKTEEKLGSTTPKIRKKK